MDASTEQRIKTLEETVAHILQLVEYHDKLHKMDTKLFAVISSFATEVGERLDTPFIPGELHKRHFEGINCVVCHDEGCEFCPVSDGSSGLSADS